MSQNHKPQNRNFPQCGPQQLAQPRHRAGHPKRLLSVVCLAAGLTLTQGLTVYPAMAQASAEQSGYTLLERGWIADAIREFQRAVDQQPQSVSAQLGLAIAYQRAGQDADAWQTYQRVLTLAPTNRQALAAVGELGGYRAAWQPGGIEALTTLLQLEPENIAARAQRALLLGYQGRFGESLADYDQVLAANPSPAVVLEAAQIYTYSGNYAQALPLFEQALAAGISLPAAAVTAYGQTLQEVGRAADAVALLEGQLSASPNSIELQAALAVAYQANNQPQQALQTIAPLRDRPADTLTVARALSRIARAASDTALYQEAVAFYQQALAATPNPSQGLVTEVADVFSEDPASQPEALELYDQLLAATPDQPALQTKRQILAAALGQVTRSELTQALLSILQPLPQDAVIQQQIGQALVPLESPDVALLPIYQALLQTERPVPFLHFRVAQLHLAQENWSAARGAIAAYQATAAGRQDTAPALFLADLERRQGNLEASAQQYEAILSTAQSAQAAEAALLGLSGIRQSQQRLEEALLAYDQLLAITPQNPRAPLGQAYLALRLQRISPLVAESALETWLARYPEITPAVVVPELFDLVGALPPADSREALYETLLAIAPEHIGVNRRYAQLLAQRDPEAAIAYARQLTPSDPAQVDLYFVQGEVAQTVGDLSLASSAYEAILTQRPDDANALAALAGVRFQQTRFNDAEQLYTRVLELRPGDFDTRRILAELNLARDYPIQAFETFTELQAEEAAASLQPPLEFRTQDIRLNFLRRRGFQPPWERF